MNRTKTAGRATAIPDILFALVSGIHSQASRRKRTWMQPGTWWMALLREGPDDGGQLYLDALSDLVIVYEQDHHAWRRLPPHEFAWPKCWRSEYVAGGPARETGLAKPR